MITLINPQATEQLAQVIGQTAMPGDNLILTGDLGAGKTTITKGIGKGLGITQMIKSPTYTIIREYTKGRLPLYHMDIYRIESGAEDLGLEEYFEGEGLAVVEWGNMLEEAKPDDYLELILTKDDTDEEKRFVKFIPFGPKSTAFNDRIKAKWAILNE